MPEAFGRPTTSLWLGQRWKGDSSYAYREFGQAAVWHCRRSGVEVRSRGCVVTSADSPLPLRQHARRELIIRSSRFGT
jgi:hypothetical protein